MFEIPGSNVEKVLVDCDVVLNKKRPEYRYRSLPANDEEEVDKVERSLWPMGYFEQCT